MSVNLMRWDQRMGSRFWGKEVFVSALSMSEQARRVNRRVRKSLFRGPRCLLQRRSFLWFVKLKSFNRSGTQKSST